MTQIKLAQGKKVREVLNCFDVPFCAFVILANAGIHSSLGSNVEMDLRFREDDGGLVLCMVVCWGGTIDFFVLIILFTKL